MGKLAERYGDAARSGVYGVRDPAIPRTAAREADALLLEFTGERLAAAWARVEEAIGPGRGRSCVLIVSEAAVLAHPEHRAVLETLVAAARACRDSGRPFFAVMVDPDARLGLPPLYRESETPP